MHLTGIVKFKLQCIWCDHP